MNIYFFSLAYLCLLSVISISFYSKKCFSAWLKFSFVQFLLNYRFWKTFQNSIKKLWFFSNPFSFILRLLLDEAFWNHPFSRARHVLWNQSCCRNMQNCTKTRIKSAVLFDLQQFLCAVSTATIMLVTSTNSHFRHQYHLCQHR